MALTFSTQSSAQSPTLTLGSFRAPDFSLPGVDGRSYSLSQFKKSKALLVVFMCNHCPYVIAVQDRLNALAREFAAQGLAMIGINSNDPDIKADDDFEAMQRRAREQDYAFAYVQDLSQEVARAYGAVCTPDLYLFENTAKSDTPEFVLRYHGRIDDNWKEPQKVTRRELADAIAALLAGRPVPEEQSPSMGCSIKWRNPTGTTERFAPEKLAIDLHELAVAEVHLRGMITLIRGGFRFDTPEGEEILQRLDRSAATVKRVRTHLLQSASG